MSEYEQLNDSLPAFNIFGLNVIQLSFLYNLTHGLITDEELEIIEKAGRVANG